MHRLNRRTHPVPVAPVRIVHLGIGAFHRAHQAWYTQRADTAARQPGTMPWGIAAFTGRSPRAALELMQQDGLYTLLVKDGGSTTTEVVSALSAVHDGSDADAWLGAFRSPAVSVLTVTVTEAGYAAAAGSDPRAPLPGSPVGRIVAGLRARRDADAGPISLVSCDNLMDNGGVLRSAVEALAEVSDPGLLPWIADSVGFVCTVVDRITPATTEADRRLASTLCGYTDLVPVVTEPFSEWILEDTFAAARPPWELAGAAVVADVEPWERRKLWLLNGAHTALAYIGARAGASTVSEAMRIPAVARVVETYWSEVLPVLGDEIGDPGEYLGALRSRFANTGIQHELSQIGRDGAHKLPARTLAVMRARVQHGLAPGDAGATVVAAWLARLRQHGAGGDPAASALAAQLGGGARSDAARAVDALAPDLAVDAVVDGIAAALTALERSPEGAIA